MQQIVINCHNFLQLLFSFTLGSNCIHEFELKFTINKIGVILKP